MNFRRYFKLCLLCLLIAFNSCKSSPDPVVVHDGKEITILPPAELYGNLFYDAQTRAIFEDSKTFVDANPKYSVGLIRQRYDMLEDTTVKGMKTFLDQHFSIPEADLHFKSDSLEIGMHIKSLWEVLKRPANDSISGTLIPLPNDYIVPGGRFREVYYWDSYFTMLGLQLDGENEVIRNMVENFAFLIDELGFIPNGNRTYYLGRSQPPFFSLMVDILADIEGEQVYAEFLDVLEQEHKFWMNGSKELKPGNATNRVVKLKDGTILNRYYDEFATPRPESYREDVETAEIALKTNPMLKKEDIYRDLRAGAESGWDYSSRWLVKNERNEFNLSSIQTTSILPVDLNSLLYQLERTISRAAKIAERKEMSATYAKLAEDRRQAIKNYFWDPKKEFFQDYNFEKQEFTGNLSLAAMYPLFFQIADEQQAGKVATRIKEDFLKPGGVVTTPYSTGQQWDAPNGWAPLQWVTIEGLRNYKHLELSEEIKTRWLDVNSAVYNRTYKMTEKYNVIDLSKESGGGEYPTQDGFGWTNGVYKKLSSEE
ncbi:alpha,alpha-trehalase TreA [Christiangramia sp. OXR-203]|jgi:alpha,alpha-trehalase|uniref:alpha,alpha-trehalase TreA n=1 Tax=Christiangramia sp. OXR-203 TaxID=3100176 RepID=UPI002AC8BB7D|nr:alpha,alpha-trehalase TreA [Christiangramia sp. OXR-203]WPY97777.1 alpha,alpha-trehalase TreA [Christiangramia sp. OXR-203]